MFTKSIIQVKNVKYYDIDEMIADMINNKKTKFKRDISLVSVTQSYFKVPKDARLNSTHFFVMKILKKKRTSTKCAKPFIRH